MQCRCVHNFGTCKKNASAKYRLPTNFAAKHVLEPEVDRKLALRSRIPFASTGGVHKSGSHSLLRFDSQNIYQIRREKINASARRLLAAALLERYPQLCRIKIMFTLLPINRFVSTTTNSMKRLVNWIPLKIRVRSRNTPPHLTLHMRVTLLSRLLQHLHTHTHTYTLTYIHTHTCIHTHTHTYTPYHHQQ